MKYNRPIILDEEEIKEFLLRLDKVRKGENECWPWHDRSEYGYFKSYISSRVSFYVATGTDPGEHLICHSCDNPPCINPAHLFRGTALDNSADAMKKGRLISRHGYTKPIKIKRPSMFVSKRRTKIQFIAKHKKLGVWDGKIWRLIRVKFYNDFDELLKTLPKNRRN